MKIMLIHPPLDDPTIPYHSTAYLLGHLRARGFTDAVMRDVNVEYVTHALTEEAITAYYDVAEDRLAALGRQQCLRYPEQEAFYALIAARRVAPREIVEAASALRRRDTFLDFSTYVKSVNTLTSYLTFLGALSYPSDTRGFMPVTRGRFSVANLRDLTDARLAEAVCAPFTRYFDEAIARDPQFVDAELFGISIVYDHQLFHAIHFARLLKQRWPRKKVVFGGTGITQFYKYLSDKARVRELFTVCDGIVVGEGETAICEIAGADDPGDGRAFSNTITYSHRQDRIVYPGNRYENVSALGAPVYDHPWELYLSPHRGINYSPTRGCYWNRCTFCDYGLNTDKPTSPWRERRIEQVVDDLRGAQRDHGVEYVYFAVDVMAPAYLERMGDAFLEAGLRIRWAAELRMEKVFTRERAEKMARAGCVCVSFGMESGNQRILDLMDKGTRLDYMRATMRNFASAGIACQIMAFTDFPTETQEEKAATFDFIRGTADHWSSGGVGTFLLTGTAAVAKDPARFGIRLVETKDADVHRAVAYRVEHEAAARVSRTEDADASFDDQRDLFPRVFARPWAGGTDSLHTMIYYDAFGRDFFKGDPFARVNGIGRSDGPIEDLSLTLNGRLLECRFDLSSILRNRRAFLAYLKDRVSAAAEPTFAAFCEWASGVESIARDSQPVYWLVLGKDCVRLNDGLVRLLRVAASRRVTLGQVLARVPEHLRAGVVQYLSDLEREGFIAFNVQGRSVGRQASPGPAIVLGGNMQMTREPAWRIG